MKKQNKTHSALFEPVKHILDTEAKTFPKKRHQDSAFIPWSVLMQLCAELQPLSKAVPFSPNTVFPLIALLAPSSVGDFYSY